MKYCTVNNSEEDNKIADELHNMLIEMNLRELENESSNGVFAGAVSFASKAVNIIFGAKGYYD